MYCIIFWKLKVCFKIECYFIFLFIYILLLFKFYMYIRIYVFHLENVVL